MINSKMFALLTFILLLGCDSSTDMVNDSSTLQKTVTENGISYTLSIPQMDYLISDSLTFMFQVLNQSNTAKEFGFANQQQYGFELLNKSDSVAMFFPNIIQPAGSGFILQSNESKQFSFSVLFKDHNGNYIATGVYQLSTYLREGKSPKVSLQINVK